MAAVWNGWFLMFREVVQGVFLSGFTAHEKSQEAFWRQNLLPKYTREAINGRAVVGVGREPV